MKNFKFIKVIIKNLVLIIIILSSCSKVYASNDLFSLWLDEKNSPKYQFIQGFNPNKGVVIIYENNNIEEIKTFNFEEDKLTFGYNTYEVSVKIKINIEAIW